MRLELNARGEVINELHVDDERGELYPDDTRMDIVDTEGRPLGRGPLRILGPDRQAPDWPARAARRWNRETGIWEPTGQPPVEGDTDKARRRLSELPAEPTARELRAAVDDIMTLLDDPVARNTTLRGGRA